jgi:hypothetical protein
MPLKRMLADNRSFDPKAVALLLEAFEAYREKVAKIVMRLAHGQTEIDPGKIRAEADAQAAGNRAAKNERHP